MPSAKRLLPESVTTFYLNLNRVHLNGAPGASLPFVLLSEFLPEPEQSSGAKRQELCLCLNFYLNSVQAPFRFRLRSDELCSGSGKNSDKRAKVVRI